MNVPLAPRKHPHFADFRAFVNLGSRVSRPDAERLLSSPVLDLRAIRRYLPEDRASWTAEHLVNAACALIDEAARVVADRSPATRDHPSFLELLHRNTVGGESYPALHAWCQENGYVVSISTLRKEWKTRALEIVWEWSSAEDDDGASIPAAGAEVPSQRAPEPSVRRRVPRSRLVASVGLVVVFSSAWLVADRTRVDDESDEFDFALNEVLALQPALEEESTRVTNEPFPSDSWSPVLGVASPPLADVERPVFVASNYDQESRFALWNLETNVLVWESDTVPPSTMWRTHESLDPAAARQTFYAVDFAHTEHGATLGDVVAVLFQNRASPSFVAFVDVRSGEARSWYAHPGRLEHLAVFDADGDGAGELIAVGQDNALDRPVVVALEPRMGDGAAASVMWSSGVEDAAVRILLPAVAPIQEHLRAKRLAISKIQQSDVDRGAGLFRVEVFAGKPMSSVYDVRFDLGLGRVIGGFSLPDRAHFVWQDAGLDPADHLPDLTAATEFTGTGFLDDGTEISPATPD